jgi:hypothetical protein
MATFFRHAGEGWHLASYFSATLEEKRNPSLRWDDGIISEIFA